ncbi:MAG TPA: hypothetical protein VF988_12025 [Verrucomicrobiae bacterium]
MKKSFVDVTGAAPFGGVQIEKLFVSSPLFIRVHLYYNHASSRDCSMKSVRRSAELLLDALDGAEARAEQDLGAPILHPRGCGSAAPVHP